VTALWRLALKIKYETWHLIHVVLAVVAITAGVVHMAGSGFYLVDPWKRTLWIGLAIFWIGLLLYVRMAKPLFMLRRPYIVSEVRKERGDTTTLVMRPDGHVGFRFSRRWMCRDDDPEPRRFYQRNRQGPDRQACLS
jgi:predicted ferric reductase